MENKMLYALSAAVVSGLAAGFGAGYLFAKERLEAVYADWANEEVDKSKALYEKKLEEWKILHGQYDKASPDEVAENIVAAEKYASKIEKPAETEAPKPKPPVPMTSPLRDRPIVNYNGYFRADGVGKAQAEPVVEEKAEDDPTDPKAAYDIPEEEYFRSEMQRQLKYYTVDGVVVVANTEVPFEGRELALGSTLEVFDNMTDDEDVIYVRSPMTGFDFEILRVLGSYQEEVLGVVSNE